MPTPRRSPAGSTASVSPARGARRRAAQLRCWPQATTSDIPLEELADAAAAGGFMAVSSASVVNVGGNRLRRTRTDDLVTSLPR